MNSIFIYYFKKAFNWKNLLLTIFWINFMIFFWGLFLGQKDAFTIQLILVLMANIFLIETYLYKKSSDKIILKFQKMNNRNKKMIKITLFLVVLLYSLFTLFVFLGFEWFYQLFEIVNNTAVFSPNDSYIVWLDNSWKWWVYFFYEIILMILLMITYVYFLNHFIKKANIIYGIMIILAMFSLIMIVVRPLILWFQIINDNYVFIVGKEPKKVFFVLELIFSPWMITQPFINKIILESGNVGLLKNVKYFDYSNLGIYSNLVWIPWVTNALLLIFPQFFKQKI